MINWTFIVGSLERLIGDCFSSARKQITPNCGGRLYFLRGLSVKVAGANRESFYGSGKLGSSILFVRAYPKIIIAVTDAL